MSRNSLLGLNGNGIVDQVGNYLRGIEIKPEIVPQIGRLIYSDRSQKYK
jgi:hypothetical protein